MTSPADPGATPTNHLGCSGQVASQIWSDPAERYQPRSAVGNSAAKGHTAGHRTDPAADWTPVRWPEFECSARP